MRVVAAEKGQTIAVNVPAPCPVAGDADQLRRLLFNLLDNAIKYTAAGGAITASGECLSKQVRVVVADNGNGIAAEHIPHIFDRFYRVDPARGREATEGIGLGLAICRSIVEAHGGRIDVESTVDRGTRVSFSLSAVQ
jgi:two-component system sensor histidine kinase BaeS